MSGDGRAVILGSGLLGWTAGERYTERYGAVHLRALDSIPGEPAPARTVPFRGHDCRAIAWDAAPLGAGGTLAAYVISATHSRDTWGPPVRPGERVALGSGTLFAENAGVPVIGVRPADGRKTHWLDVMAMGRCSDHLVRLVLEPAGS